MNKRIIAFVVVAFAIIAFALYYLTPAYESSSTISYIERITSVKLPANVKVIQEFDNGEFVVGGKYQLDSIATNQFINRYHFRRSPSYFWGNNSLDSVNRIDLTQADPLVYFEGCKPGNSWMFIVNPKNGELWINVQYPDMGGDAPSCDENRMEHNISNRVKLSGRGNIERKVIDTILALPEVKGRADYIEKETKGKRQLIVLIAAEPDSINNYYWVKAGEDNGDVFVTHFHFFVYPGSMRIVYYDPVEDAELSLEEWRGRQNSN